jgi:hypothetical protein
MRCASLGIGAAIVMVSAVNAKAACNFERARDANAATGVRGLLTVRVDANTDCVAPIRPSAGAILKSVSVTSRPRNGTLTSSQVSWQYAPRRDFRGEDTFAIRICFELRGASGCSDWDYRVIVR